VIWVGRVCWVGTCVASLPLSCLVRRAARGARFLCRRACGFFRSSSVAMREKFGLGVRAIRVGAGCGVRCKRSEGILKLLVVVVARAGFGSRIAVGQ